MRVRAQTEVRYSQSTAKEFMACPWAYFVSRRCGVTKRFTPAPLRRGTLIHAGYEAALLWDFAARHFDGFGSFYSGSRHLDKPSYSVKHLTNMLKIGATAIRQKQADWLASDAIRGHIDDQLLSDAEELCVLAIEVFERSFAELGVHTGEWVTLARADGLPYVEYKRTTDFEGFAEQGGTVDWVATWVGGDGCTYKIDFKTGVQIHAEDYYEVQLQAGVYVKLLEDQGVQLAGTGTWQIRAATFRKPAMLKPNKKTGKVPGVSQADCMMTWPAYAAFVESEGFDVEKYREKMQERLDARVWQRMDLYIRSKKEVENVWYTYLQVADRMRAADKERERLRVHLDVMDDGTPGPSYPRNLNTFTCKSCRLRSYCLADLDGKDLERLRQTDYATDDETNSKHIIDGYDYDEET